MYKYLGLIIFLLIFATMLAATSFALKFVEASRKKKVHGLLKSASGEDAPDPHILVNTGEKPGAPAFLSQLPVYKHLESTLAQGAVNLSPAALMAMMAIGVIAGAFLGFRVAIPVFREFTMAGLALLLGALPYVWVRHKRTKRLRKFEEQFPEALDFLARSMRAGHAFSVSLEMMAAESPDPVGIEFRRLFHEQNLGSPLPAAMRNLAERVPLLDVRFFVSAVLMQRETGGNLAEILTKLGYLIRERFRLKGQVRAVSAHGRMTALVLSMMPFVTAGLLTLIAPSYLSSMAADSDGKYLIVGAVVNMLLGYWWMKVIINIKV